MTKLLTLYNERCYEPYLKKELKAPINNLKILVFLHNSYPFANGGYATRADGILSALSKTGFNIVAYTRPGFPEDQIKSTFCISDKEDQKKNKTQIKYQRLNSDVKRINARFSYTYMLESYKKYLKIIIKENPDLVLGRSTYLVSFPVLIAAKEKKIPFIYEVSGLWELVFKSREKLNYGSIISTTKLETLTANASDLVFTLTKAMRNVLISRGANEDKIFISPNCASKETIDFFKRKSIDKNEDFTFGYIGSFQFYEGLEDLIDAFGICCKKKKNIKLKLIGDGPWMNNIKEKIKNFEYKDLVELPGRVDKSKVFEYYKKIDVCIYPRKSLEVTEIVSPVKPLEAMLIGIPIIVSNVQALIEMVKDKKTGLVFEKDDTEDLARQMLFCINNRETCFNIGENASKWVLEHRTWDKVAAIMSDKMKRILKF